jgi:protocatechuate 3,4-dioxygenase beta subunit
MKGSGDTMRIISWILALVFVLAVAVSARAPAIVLAGRVVDDGSGDRVRNARVTLSPASAQTPVMLTDETGRCRFTAPAGRHTVAASKTGYVRAEISAAAFNRPIVFRLKKGAMLTGRIVDDDGEPVANAEVTALAVPARARRRKRSRRVPPTTAANTASPGCRTAP